MEETKDIISLVETSYVSEYGILGGKMVTTYQNICTWYDGTLRPAKGHNGGCRWRFDGQVWFHL